MTILVSYDKYKAYRLRHPDRVRDARDKRIALAKAFVDAAMAGGCVDCGNKNLGVLDLDHVRGEKINHVSALSSGRYSWKILFAEIDKCEARCANCHRLKTKERGYYNARKKAA